MNELLSGKNDLKEICKLIDWIANYGLENAATGARRFSRGDTAIVEQIGKPTKS